ncbi:MAG TPA: hypothetical protein VF556_09165 [Pyrinomonadaceae bacterium]|jgi:hypothetical protein
MNHLDEIDSFETVESLMEQIESDYIVSENDKPVISKHLEEYFWLKETAAPSVISAKWTEISKTLDTFDMKVKQ